MRLSRRNRSSQSNIDRFAITPAQVDTLAEQVRDPLTHTERCVDELTFLPAGGHRSTRNLQILIPASAAPPDRSWRVVSLGVFPPGRFPDFTVRDCAGQRLNLLTRRQHGLARTEARGRPAEWRRVSRVGPSAILAAAAVRQAGRCGGDLRPQCRSMECRTLPSRFRQAVRIVV